MTRLARPPLPPDLVVDQWTAPFWAAARERRLVICACAACDRLRMPPGPFCPKCQSQAIAWREVSGSGVVYTYTIVRTAEIGSQEQQAPYAPAVIALDGASDIRLISAVVDCDAVLLRVNAPVRLVWHELERGQVVPLFTALEPP